MFSSQTFSYKNVNNNIFDKLEKENDFMINFDKKKCVFLLKKKDSNCNSLIANCCMKFAGGREPIGIVDGVNTGE